MILELSAYSYPMSEKSTQDLTEAIEPKKVQVETNSPTIDGAKKGLEAKAEKQATKKEKSEKDSPKTINFYEWLTSYSQGKNLEKLKLQIPGLNKDFVQLAEELINAKEDTVTRPSASFKLDKIPSTYFKGLVQQTSNPYFIVTLIFNSQIEDSLRKHLVKKVLSTIPNSELSEYLIHKFESNLSKNLLSQIADEFLTELPAYSEHWGIYQLEVLNRCISLNLVSGIPNKLLQNLDSAHLNFKNLETAARNRVLRKMLDGDEYLLFWSYLIHIGRENTPSDFLEDIIGKKAGSALFCYLENRVILSGSWQARFESRNIISFLKNHMNQIMKLSELLPFLEFQESLEQLLPSDVLPRAVARCYKREDSLSGLFADKRVSGLDSELETSQSDLKALQLFSSKLESDLEIARGRITAFEQAVQSLESKLRSQISEGSSGNAAIINQGKVEALKAVIESIEHIFSSEAGAALERSLQKAGIFRIGVPGAMFTWDAETCESLTGNSFDAGIVIRSGYTWDSGTKNVLIQRALLREN
jgi:hypothetical protein